MVALLSELCHPQAALEAAAVTVLPPVFAYPKHAAIYIIIGIMERAVYRIIDANFNRSREALRVMEEFCRFALNAKPLSARAKQIRHSISQAIAKLDAESLLACRESDTDRE